MQGQAVAAQASIRAACTACSALAACIDCMHCISMAHHRFSQGWSGLLSNMEETTSESTTLCKTRWKAVTVGVGRSGVTAMTGNTRYDSVQCCVTCGSARVATAARSDARELYQARRGGHQAWSTAGESPRSQRGVSLPRLAKAWTGLPPPWPPPVHTTLSIFRSDLSKCHYTVWACTERRDGRTRQSPSPFRGGRPTSRSYFMHNRFSHG